MDEVLRYLGYSGQEMDPALRRRMGAIVDSCEDELDCHGIWATFPVRHDTDGLGERTVVVEGTTLVLTGHDITEHLSGASACALMVSTLGAESARRLEVLGATDQLAQVVYDAACTDLIERGTDELEAQVVAWAHGRGLYTSYRYGPGYGDLPLSVQPTILDVLSAGKRLGVTATDDCLLVPMKSETAVVGIYPEPPSNGKPGCSRCACRDYCEIHARGDVCYRRPEADDREGR
jgi:hypothetical protein